MNQFEKAAKEYEAYYKQMKRKKQPRPAFPNTWPEAVI